MYAGRRGGRMDNTGAFKELDTDPDHKEGLQVVACKANKFLQQMQRRINAVYFS